MRVATLILLLRLLGTDIVTLELHITWCLQVMFFGRISEGLKLGLREIENQTSLKNYRQLRNIFDDT